MLNVVVEAFLLLLATRLGKGGELGLVAAVEILEALGVSLKLGHLGVEPVSHEHLGGKSRTQPQRGQDEQQNAYATRCDEVAGPAHGLFSSLSCHNVERSDSTNGAYRRFAAIIPRRLDSAGLFGLLPEPVQLLGGHLADV